MCNHYQKHPEAIQSWAEYIGWSLPDPDGDRITDDLAEALDASDVWPKGTGLVARIEGGVRHIDAMRWGVPLTLPGKRPGTTVTKHVTNVRNLASPFWRGMIAAPERRCLVPFSRFAEPRPGKDAVTGRPAEWWFTVTGRPAAAFAGVWRPSEAGRVFAFLTCEPNPLVAPLHPKAMPVILAEDAYDTWLTGDAAAAMALAVPFSSQWMAVA